jgi:hypothetical protein
MPLFGLELLDMARDVAAFNLLARVGSFSGAYCDGSRASLSHTKFRPRQSVGPSSRSSLRSSIWPNRSKASEYPEYSPQYRSPEDWYADQPSEDILVCVADQPYIRTCRPMTKNENVWSSFRKVTITVVRLY